MLPQVGSPAIDTGDGYLDGAGGPDQRGFLRSVGLKTDIGAVEFGATLTGGGPAPPNLVLGAAPGSRPEVRLLRADGSEVSRFLAYDQQFLGGVQVAMDEVTGDGVPDIITAAGPGGGPHVKVFDGFTLREIRSFFAFDPEFRGGVTLSALYQKILVGAGPGGGPHVKVFNATTVTEEKSFFAFDPGFRGGVTVALAGNGPVYGGLIVGAGPGGGPHVRLFHPDFLSIHYDFMAYDPGFRGGVSVASLNGLIVTGTLSGAPHVKAFRDLRSWWGIGLGRITWPITSLPEVASFYAGDSTGTTGVTIGTAGTFNWPERIPANSYYPRTYGEHALFTSVGGELTRYSIQPDDDQWDPTLQTFQIRRSKLGVRPLPHPVSGAVASIGGLPSMVEV